MSFGVPPMPGTEELVSKCLSGSGAPVWTPPDTLSSAHIADMKRSVYANENHDLNDRLEAATEGRHYQL
jgi:hypothetical protein